MEFDVSDKFFFGYTHNNFVNSFETSMPKNNDLRKEKSFLEYSNDLNLHNCRSDNFTDSHDGMHVLFSGCSITFGEGLEKDELWSWKVYEELGKINKLSGYFNLAQSGTSIGGNILKLFKYFNEFGNPDVIFLNLPDAERFVSARYNESDAKLDISGSLTQNGSGKLDISEQSLFFIKAMNFELYNMLDSYCRAAGIRLISFTWMKKHSLKDEETSVRGILKSFDSFYDIDNIYKSDRYCYDYIKQVLGSIKNDIPLMVARDGEHPGVIQNLYFADTALRIFNGGDYRWIKEHK